MRAEALLQSQTFNFVKDHVLQQYVDYLFSTKPTETAEREAVYFRRQALNDLIGQLGSYVQAKDALTEQLSLEEEQQHHHD